MISWCHRIVLEMVLLIKSFPGTTKIYFLFLWEFLCKNVKPDIEIIPSNYERGSFNEIWSYGVVITIKGQ